MKNEWEINPRLLERLCEGHVNVAPVFDNPKAEIIHVDTIHEWQLQDNDIIILTFDIERWDLKEVKQMIDCFIKAFPNNKVLAKYNGVEIDIVHTDKNESEVSW